ncbi:hypothetical protein [Rubripirellula lacrimiformis]|nr:hypothetical protein [Rubripirellula lacrimiformis]
MAVYLLVLATESKGWTNGNQTGVEGRGHIDAEASMDGALTRND